MRPSSGSRRPRASGPRSAGRILAWGPATRSSRSEVASTSRSSRLIRSRPRSISRSISARCRDHAWSRGHHPRRQLMPWLPRPEPRASRCSVRPTARGCVRTARPCGGAPRARGPSFVQSPSIQSPSSSSGLRSPRTRPLIRLRAVACCHSRCATPDPERLGRLLGTLGIEATITRAPSAGLGAVLATPNGEVRLGS